MPTVKHITRGEICNMLRGVWGEYVAQGGLGDVKKFNERRH